MKNIYSFFLILLCTYGLSAQDSLPVYNVNESGATYSMLSEEGYKYLELQNKHLSLKELVAHGDKPFPDDENVFEIDVFNDRESWVWYRLKNTGTQPYIVALFAQYGKATVYVRDNGTWHTFKTGSKKAWSEKDGDRNNNYIPYKISAGAEILVYINQSGMNVSPKIGNYLKVVNEEYHSKTVFSSDDVITFGIAGFILFGMVINLLFYYVSREKLYLVYSLMLFFSALTVADTPISELFFKEHTDWYLYFEVFEGTGFVLMFIYTVRYFFNMKDYFPRWDKIFTYAAPIFIGLSFVFIFVLYLLRGNNELIGLKFFIFALWCFSFLLMIILFCAFMVLLVWMLVVFAKRKDREARLFTIALVPFFGSFVVNIFLSYKWLTEFAWMWTMVVLSWGLFARFKRLQEEYAKQALEKERIAREKEEEKNLIIAEQNVRLEKLVTERTADLEKSLNELKQTQDQLIQSEKMASLGELTAGIAHEIQNPLNFVNNFSDVSIELLDEMEEELERGDTDEVKAIVGDVKSNLEKIAHHGRRADGIVKGMLQHSRASTGQKEPTDINALADEYFRLAYHGLRAKDKSFNAELIMDFDENLPKISIASQDVGRVLLNLFTNAFYATQQKQKQDATYKPRVKVTTQISGSNVEIRVYDNGTGIPDEIKDKILQPFFTTKPTGQGTGLGLSLSYDIIVKGHGGTIDIHSEEGAYSEFIIRIPLEKEN